MVNCTLWAYGNRYVSVTFYHFLLITIHTQSHTFLRMADQMLKELSPKAEQLRQELLKFMDDHVYPAEQTVKEYKETASDRWTIPPIIEELKQKAKAIGA